MKTTSIAVAALALVLAAGCKKSEDLDTSFTKTTSATEPQSAARTPLAKSDQEFMTKAAQGGMLEVALGQEVIGKASSADVKSFGQRMIDDHGKADDELKTIATNKGVTLPVKLDDDHQKTLDDMAKLSGAKLDKAYTKDMVSDHEEDVNEFRDAANDIKDPELRAWAQKTLPTLESHLATIKDIQAKQKNAK